MPIPEPVGSDAHRLACRWTLDPTLAQGLVDLDGYFRKRFASEGFRWPGIWITSGYRSQATQAQVNPDAPDSLHTNCPSLAVDLRVGAIPGLNPVGGYELLAMIGVRWKWKGFRWGGDFTPPDPIHFDLGIPSFLVRP